MNQLHVSDAKDMAESVAASVAASVAEHAGDVVHELADRVRAVREPDAPEPERRRARVGRTIAWLLVVMAAAGFAALVARRSQRSRPAPGDLAPDAGDPSDISDSDVPGPALDPDNSPMTVEASVRGAR